MAVRMRRPLAIGQAMILAAVCAVQPALAAPRPGPVADPSAPASVATVLVVDGRLAEGAAAARADLDARRDEIARQLIDLGRAPETARALADQLTDEDLQVLLANPRMMQPAGDSSKMVLNIVVAALVVGGIVALALAADGSIVQN